MRSNTNIKSLDKFEKEDVVKILSSILKMPLLEIRSLADPNSNNSSLEILIASLVVKAIKMGDIDIYERLMEQLIGKAKSEIELSGNSLAPLIVIGLPDNGYSTKKPEVVEQKKISE